MDAGGPGPREQPGEGGLCGGGRRNTEGRELVALDLLSLLFVWLLPLHSCHIGSPCSSWRMLGTAPWKLPAAGEARLGAAFAPTAPAFSPKRACSRLLPHQAHPVWGGEGGVMRLNRRVGVSSYKGSCILLSAGVLSVNSHQPLLKQNEM